MAAQRSCHPHWPQPPRLSVCYKLARARSGGGTRYVLPHPTSTSWPLPLSYSLTPATSRAPIHRVFAFTGHPLGQKRTEQSPGSAHDAISDRAPASRTPQGASARAPRGPCQLRPPIVPPIRTGASLLCPPLGTRACARQPRRRWKRGWDARARMMTRTYARASWRAWAFVWGGVGGREARWTGYVGFVGALELRAVSGAYQHEKREERGAKASDGAVVRCNG